MATIKIAVFQSLPCLGWRLEVLRPILIVAFCNFKIKDLKYQWNSSPNATVILKFGDTPKSYIPTEKSDVICEFSLSLLPSHHHSFLKKSRKSWLRKPQVCLVTEPKFVTIMKMKECVNMTICVITLMVRNWNLSIPVEQKCPFFGTYKVHIFWEVRVLGTIKSLLHSVLEQI